MSIAIVDDDEALREAMECFVQSLGYNVSTFGSAEEFLNSEQVSKISCLITDLNMPGLSGLDMQSRLIGEGYKVPIVFITAYPEERHRQRALQDGAVCFIAKPYSERHLIGCLERALSSGDAGTA